MFVDVRYETQIDFCWFLIRAHIFFPLPLPLSLPLPRWVCHRWCYSSKLKIDVFFSLIHTQNTIDCHVRNFTQPSTAEKNCDFFQLAISCQAYHSWIRPINSLESLYREILWKKNTTPITNRSKRTRVKIIKNATRATNSCAVQPCGSHFPTQIKYSDLFLVCTWYK